jgi:glycosyltransferase involved in cell wall biosynthesis
MRILLLSRWFPYPADNGSKIRILNILRQLAKRHEVSLLSFAPDNVPTEHSRALQSVCSIIETVRYRPYRPWSRRALTGLLDERPRSVVDTLSQEMTQRAARLTRQWSPEVVIASQIDMAPYALQLEAGARVLEELEVTALYQAYAYARGFSRLRAGLTWWKLARYIRRILPAFDLCTVVSEAEQKRLLAVTAESGRVEVAPNGLDLSRYAGAPELPVPETLIYAGALTYSANFDAVEYFLRDIYPRILAQRPGAKFVVTGPLEGVPTNRLPRPSGLTLTGYLEDVRPAIACSWASVVPLREGGGTRLKILESLALGTPVVATRKGAEGLELVAGRDALIADDAASFASATLTLLADPDLRARLSQQGRRVVEMRYDWRAIGERLNNLLEEVVADRQARRRPELRRRALA